MSVDFDTLNNRHNALVRCDNTISSDRDEEIGKSQLTMIYLLLKLCKAKGLDINCFMNMVFTLFVLF